MSTELVANAVVRAAAVVDVPVYPDEAPDRVQGTGTSVVEIRDSGFWGPTPNGARHRVLRIDVLSDPTRDSTGLPTADDADRKAWAIWEKLDDEFNDTNHEWSQVHTSRRAWGPTLVLLPDGDRSVMLSVGYEVSHD